MMKLGIIADDLTGANDTGVQFAKVGLRTLVLWETKGIEASSKEYEVVVVDTESRGDAKEEAYRKAFAAANALKLAGASHFYKKIDSTLRGSIGAELDGVMDALGTSLAIICPAYPRNRRLTIGGYLLVGGIPVDRTEVARDPTAPVKESHIPTLIAKQSRRKVSHIPLIKVAQGHEKVKENIQNGHDVGAEIFVPDAASEEDLRTIVRAATSIPLTVLLCGSAGLAEEVPQAFGLLPKRGGILVLAGTVSAVTSRQTEVLAGMLNAKVLTIDTDEMFGGEDRRRGEAWRVQSQVGNMLHEGGDVVVRWAGSNQEAEQAKKKSALKDGRELSRIVLATFNDIAVGLLDRSLLGIVLTGGDTAMSIIGALDAKGIQVLGEVEPGVPAATVAGGKLDGLKVVTKAGAFGDDFTLTRIVQYLRWTR